VQGEILMWWCGINGGCVCLARLLEESYEIIQKLKEVAYASSYIIINHTRPIAISQPPLRPSRSRFIHEAEVFPRVQVDFHGFTPAGAREQIVRRAWTPCQAMR